MKAPQVTKFGKFVSLKCLYHFLALFITSGPSMWQKKKKKITFSGLNSEFSHSIECLEYMK